MAGDARPPTPRTILITGASGGIGAALAAAYAGPDVRLLLLGRDQPRLAATAEACRELGAAVETAALDTTDRAQTRATLLALDSRHPVDLAIANAGVSTGQPPEGGVEPQDRALDTLLTNVMGTAHTLAPLIERMSARGGGQLCLIGSLAARYGLPSCPAYSASKAAVEIYGEGLRGHLRPYGVRVTVASPGFVESAMSDRIVGPAPLKLPAGRAARLVKRALARDRARVSFPFPLNLGVWCLARLPDPLARPAARAFAFRVRP
jgi:short-subunit dehydrogenase